MANGFGFSKLRPGREFLPERPPMMAGPWPGMHGGFPTTGIGQPGGPPMMTGPWPGMRGGMPPMPGIGKPGRQRPEMREEPRPRRQKRFGGPDFLRNLRAMMGIGYPEIESK